MIDGLIRLSLRHRILVLGAAVAVTALGLSRAVTMPVDVFPDLSAPRVTIVTEATGLAPVEVERLVTFPIEAAMSGASGVRRVRSASAAGVSVVWVEFDWETPGAVARQRVTERVQGVTSVLPPEAEAPFLAPPSSVLDEIVLVALTSETVPPMELRRIADIKARRELLGVPGVAQVVATGGLVREFQVLLDPALLEHYRVGVDEVVEAVEAGNRNAPGGFLVDRGQEAAIRVLGRAHGVRELQRIVVTTRGGVPVTVAQLAEVRVGPAVPRGTGSYRGEPAVVLSITKQPGADTLATTERLDEALDTLAASLSSRGIVVHRDIFRQADFITTAIDNLLSVLRDGAILVVGVLLLFLWSFRPTFISALALPISLLTAVLVLDFLGFSLDTMTLGGFAIAVGALVDDAIVDVENVVRRLRDRLALPEADRPPLLATVLKASVEVRSSIVSATLVLGLAFLPLLLLGGLEGRLLMPLGIAYLIALAASLVVSVTVTPALCLMLLPRGVERTGAREPPSMRLVHRAYEPVLRLSLRRPGLVVGGGALLVAAGVAGLLGVGRSFLPEFNEGNIVLSAVTLPGTSLEQSDALGSMVERALLSDPAVVATARRTGRAEADEHVQGVESAEIEVRLRRDARSRDELFADLRERLAAVPGVNVTLGQPISHRIDHMVSGQRTALSIKVIGEELLSLRRTAEAVRERVADVEGLVDLAVEPIVDTPHVIVHVNPESAASYGLSTGQAASLVGTALWGTVAGHIYEEGSATDVVVRFDDEARRDLEAVRSIQMPTPVGALVPLSAFADVRRDTGPSFVLREDVRRRVAVTANVAGRDLRSVYEDVRERVSTMDLPEGVQVAYAGQFEREEETGRSLLLFGAIAILGIALIVGTTLGSVRRTLIVLVNLPLALTGGVAGVYLSGGVLSVASTIGFITLFGIATRNGILLATRMKDLSESGVERLEAAERAARERLAPILMTALCAGLGLLPLALAAGQPGSEIQAPMAAVILGGLLTSTALNMVVVPALLSRWG